MLIGEVTVIGIMIELDELLSGHSTEKGKGRKREEN